MGTSLLLDLPVELLILILSHVHWRHLVQCSSVCKTFHKTITTSLELQYKIELGADLLVDLSSSSPTSQQIPTATRLSLLLSRRRAWSTLSPTRTTHVPMPGTCQAYELVGGVFAKTSQATLPHVWGAHQFNQGSRRLIARWLPGRDDGDDGGVLERDDLGVATRDFAIDPGQDLIALIEHEEAPASPHPRVTIHLRTLSTNTPHPASSCTTFTHPTPFRIMNAFIQIVDDVVGLFFWAEGPGLLVWGWRTGKVAVYATEPQISPNTWDFSFLSSRSYLLTRTGSPGSVELYTFELPSPSTPTSSAVAPQSTTPTTSPNPNAPCNVFSPFLPVGLLRTSTYTQPNHVASLLLPPLIPGTPLSNFSTHSGPFSSPPRWTGGNTGVGSQKLFGVSEEARVHVMSLCYHVGSAIPTPASANADGDGEAQEAREQEAMGGRRERFVMFVMNKTFLEVVGKWERQEGGDGGGGSGGDVVMRDDFGVGREEEGGKGKGKGKEQEKRERKRIILTWDEWGPDHTRFLPLSFQFQWLRYVYGSRVCCPPIPIHPYVGGEERPAQMMQVLDFNVHPPRRGPSALPISGSLDSSTNSSSRCSSFAEEEDGLLVKTNLVLHATTLNADSIFQQPVTSRLGYKRVSRVLMGKARRLGRVVGGGAGGMVTGMRDDDDEDGDSEDEEDGGRAGNAEEEGELEEFSGFMIDDERIIGLRSTAFSDGDMSEICVFAF
ncbi:hypothetical protein JAAARDRAFT_40121 [Jaapia argillacea MUCL 33604]|uniref:F-box domain-containing protein n=1 Tax=Jaapia argillacea MUCL 33604 TaxID=933084 RepID=A0A067PMI1_9AGAM|nr:hypothetical protein JAAARDRAFT_40121 [Jaapia argillacea MUCL 33604]